MTIDIQRPEVETAIRRHMATGEFHDVDELLGKALEAFQPAAATLAVPEGESFLAMFDKMRGLLTDEEVDTLFTRNPSPDRPIDLL